MPDDTLLSRLAEEFTRAVREGKPPEIEEYERRYPDLAGRIRALFPTLMLLEGMATAGGCGAEAARSQLLSPGQHFGPYTIVRLCGKGGMGEVYEAEHTGHGRRVALKVVGPRLTDPADRARFLREGQLAASVNHPNCVYIYGTEEINGTSVIAMEILPGGTLKDRVTEDGPMAPRRAVDAILQVIAGLEAAESAGILHRDIKPSNCFVDSDGTVKVGDFGLSISTLARDTTSLTLARTIRGTPAYASPEQLRGEPLDLRADIYSVGATLYYLITGKPPFDDRELMALLTRVATEKPRSPRVLRPRVPRGLAKIVLQCLEKDKLKRPASYARLRQALIPFGLRGRTAAVALFRVAAGVVDYFVVNLLVNVWNALLLSSPSLLGLGRWWLFLPLVTATIYFTVMEGLAGGSLGKLFVGLRVRETDGSKPEPFRLVLRSTVFAIAGWPFWIQPFLRFLLPRWYSYTRVRVAAAILPEVVCILLVLTLFLTARRRNGFAGVHELISGTRVTAEGTPFPWRRHFPVQTAAAPASRGGPGMPVRGPYLLVEPLSDAASGSLSRGFDPVLKREVWIRDVPAGGSLSDAARRSLSRRGRLRWLAGQQATGSSWEAFEAPRGISLLSSLTTPQPWHRVRNWLADLIEELSHGLMEHRVPPLALDRVWITPDDHARLLDFTPPDTEPACPVTTIGASDDERAVLGFLRSVVWSALLGRIESDPKGPAVLKPPLPTAGTAILRTLSETQPGQWKKLRTLCRRAGRTPATVSMRRRILLPVLFLVMLTTPITRSIATWYAGSDSFRASDQAVLFNCLASIERLRRTGGPESASERWALETYVVARFAPFGSRGEFDQLPYFRSLVRELAVRRPSVEEDDLRVALDLLGSDRIALLNHITTVNITMLAFLPAMAVSGAFGIAALFLAFVFRGGLTLRLFGIAVVDGAGIRVSRWRALFRAALAWLPVIVFALLPQSAIDTLAAFPALGYLTLGTVVVVMTVGILWSVAEPARSLQDHLARTYLVQS